MKGHKGRNKFFDGSLRIGIRCSAFRFRTPTFIFVLGGEEQILPGESERWPQPERAAGVLPEEPHPGGEGGCTHPTGHPALRYQLPKTNTYLPPTPSEFVGWCLLLLVFFARLNLFKKLETIGNETEKKASFIEINTVSQTAEIREFYRRENPRTGRLHTFSQFLLTVCQGKSKPTHNPLLKNVVSKMILLQFTCTHNWFRWVWLP